MHKQIALSQNKILKNIHNLIIDIPSSANSSPGGTPAGTPRGTNQKPYSKKIHPNAPSSKQREN